MNSTTHRQTLHYTENHTHLLDHQEMPLIDLTRRERVKKEVPLLVDAQFHLTIDNMPQN